jgi:hypothetical protein
MLHIYVQHLSSQVGVICPYVIVIELDKRHVIVFLSIFHIVTMPRTKSGLLTYAAYADWSFCSTYNVFSFYGLSYSMTYTHTPLRKGTPTLQKLEQVRMRGRKRDMTG